MFNSIQKAQFILGKFHYITAAEAVDNWRDDVLTGKPPTFYRIAETGPLSRIELGPKLITLIGGAPGLSVRGVQKAMEKLKKRRLLFVLFQGGLNRGPSRYRVESLTNRGS